MKEQSFGFIGGGRITAILLRALKDAGKFPASVSVSDANEEVLNKIKREFPEVRISTDNKIPAASDLVFISLHPPVMMAALEEIKSTVTSDSIIISLAPKISMQAIKGVLTQTTKVVRMIPNAPSIIQKGYNPACFSSEMSAGEVSAIQELINIFGEAPVVEEKKLEAFAIIAAMGPTYFWFQFNKLHELGKSFGLSEEDLSKSIQAMAAGALSTLYDSGLSFEQVVDLVPVKPIAEYETAIAGYYDAALLPLYQRLTN